VIFANFEGFDQEKISNGRVLVSLESTKSAGLETIHQILLYSTNSPVETLYANTSAF
jgi:hypothetical protein